MYYQLERTKPLSEGYKGYNFIAFDVETYGDDNKFLIGSTYTDGEIITFYNKNEMFDYLLVYRPNTYIVATNLEFDFNCLFHDTEYYYKFHTIMSGGRIIQKAYETGKRERIKFIDTLNYLKASVEKLGKIIGIEKMTKPERLGQKPQNKEELNYLIQYNIQDSRITYEFMKFIQDGMIKNGSKLKLTIASSSMDLYKRKYIPITIKSEEEKFDNINKKIFQSYYGGRTEIFKRGYIKNHNYADVLSMYASVMLNEYPNPNTIKYVSYPQRNIIEYDGISFIIIDVPKMNIPLLPVMDKKLIFPTGRIKGVYTNVEIRKMVEMGGVIKNIFWSYYYTKNFYPFKDYVTDNYAKKNEHDKDELRHLYKSYLTNLYGKFGQKTMDDTQLIDYNNDNKETFKKFPKAKFTYNEQTNKGYMINPKKCTSSFVRPIFATYTTAYARIKLFELIIKYDGAYCDTDSIITRKEVYSNERLGDLRIEQFVKRGVFVKPKMYSFINEHNESVTRLKGVPKSNQEMFNDILHGKEIQYNKFMKTKESISKNITPNSIMLIKKNIKLEDDKRIWKMKFNPLIFDEYSKPHDIEIR